ncbi:hypothetical protein LEP1GSC166_0748 [Leptospira kirschneri]|nr:hypothetical protein LEP1GSC198_0334 [Leptospira kirschneri str. JB]EMK04024.1 hypothetical protein LEP1GSC166_0748 [Leptospira kirschneri]
MKQSNPSILFMRPSSKYKKTKKIFLKVAISELLGFKTISL